MPSFDYTNSAAGLTPFVFLRDGCPLHYWLGGAEGRPLVVLMHGATMDHRMFNAQAAALLPAYRVLVWDARGHGRSQPIGDAFSIAVCAEDMLAILDDIGVQSAIFCGQSLGGYIAQQIYLAAPQRVLALILIGCVPITKAYSKAEIWALKGTMPMVRFWPYSHFTSTIARRTAVTADVQEYALQAARQIPEADILTIWKAVTLAIDSKGRPGKTLDCPLLLMHGDKDSTGTIKRDMADWAHQEKGAALVVIPGAGHNANQDNPQETNRQMLAFLDRLANATAASPGLAGPPNRPIP